MEISKQNIAATKIFKPFPKKKFEFAKPYKCPDETNFKCFAIRVNLPVSRHLITQ